MSSPSAADNRTALNKANQAADADYYGSGTADSGVAGGSGITFNRDAVGSWNRRVNAGIVAAASAIDWVPAAVDASTGSSGSFFPNSEVVARGVDDRGLAWTEWSSGATSHAVPPPPVIESYALPSEVQGAGLLASGRASMNDYWSGVADAGVSEGSFVKYLAGRTMQFAGNVGYSLADMAVAVYNNPEQSLAGGLKSIANFGPEAFNGATNLVKTSLNGYSMLAEKLGAGDGAFEGFRASDAYNITPLFGYDNQAQAGGALLTQVALGAGLTKYGNYSIELNTGSAGMLSANPLPFKLVAPEPAYRQYSVAYEMRLDAADIGKSEGIHFNRANAALDSALRADAEFASMMERLAPGVQDAVSSVGGRANPPNWTWEHASTSVAFGESGVMRLVPTYQHTPGSSWWRALHPDAGAAGGYAEWARPAGAPKR